MRLKHIKNADIIYAIKDGEILEQGNHQELINKCGYYYSLVISQIGQDDEEKKNNIDQEEYEIIDS